MRANETWKAKPIIGQTGIRPYFPLFDTGLASGEMAFASNNRNRTDQGEKAKGKKAKKIPSLSPEENFSGRTAPAGQHRRQGSAEQILAKRAVVKIGMIIRRATLVVAGRSSYDAMPRSAPP